MDIISHALLPYLLGNFLRMDKKLVAAFVIGGIAPDLDVLIVWLGLLSPSPDLLLVHRGIIHSLIFGLLTALVALLLISRPPGSDIFRRWTGVDFRLSWPVASLAFVGVLMHLFLDYLITKGVPLLYPFEAARFSAELFFHYEIIITVCSVCIALYLIRGFYNKKSLSRKTNNKLLAIFLIVLLAVGGMRVEGRERAFALENGIGIARDARGDFEVFPDWGVFQWNILIKNESHFKVYSYNSLSNNISFLASYPQLHLELNADDPEAAVNLNYSDLLNGDINRKATLSSSEISDLQDSLRVADSNPKVRLFRWRACAVAVDALRNNESWSFEYYDPVSTAGMNRNSIWTKVMSMRNSSLGVNVVGDRSYVVDEDIAGISNLTGKRWK